jgi:hypothetical protein
MSYYYILNFSALFPFFVAFPMLNKSAIDHKNYKDYEVCIANQSIYGSVLGLFYIVIFIISLVILKFNYTVSFLSLGSLLSSVVSAVVFALVLFMIVNILARNKKWYKFISCIAIICFTIINISMILNKGMEFSISFKVANPLYYISENILYGVESVADIDAAILFWGIMFAISFVLLFLYSLKKVNLATNPIKVLPSYPSSCDNL